MNSEESQCSSRDLEDFMDRSAIQIADATRKLKLTGDSGLEARDGDSFGSEAGIVPKVGDELEVRNKKDGKYYRCKVMAVDGSKCKVHFIGWKARYDEWVLLNRDRFKRPVLLKSFAKVKAQQETENVIHSSLQSGASCLNTGRDRCRRRFSTSTADLRMLQGDDRPSVPLQPEVLRSIVDQSVSTGEGSRGLLADMLDAGRGSGGPGYSRGGGGQYSAFCKVVVDGSVVSCSVVMVSFTLMQHAFGLMRL